MANRTLKDRLLSVSLIVALVVVITILRFSASG